MFLVGSIWDLGTSCYGLEALCFEAESTVTQWEGNVCQCGIGGTPHTPQTDRGWRPLLVFKALFWFWEPPETLGGFWLNRRELRLLS